MVHTSWEKGLVATEPIAVSPVLPWAGSGLSCVWQVARRAESPMGVATPLTVCEPNRPVSSESAWGPVTRAAF